MVFRQIKCILSLEFITERTPALLGHFWVACKPIRKEKHCFRWIITQGTSTTRINTLPPIYCEHWQWQAASTGLSQPPDLLPAQHPWGACSLAISCGKVFLGKNCNTLPLTCFYLDTLWLPADITNKQSFWMLCCWVADDGFATGTFLVGIVVIHLWRPLSGSCCMFLILGKMQKTARALLTVGDHISLPHCHCCPQGTLPWAGGQEEVLFSGCGCAVGRWGHFTDECTAAKGRIMMLPFIGTRDFCKSYKQTLFCQAVVTVLKTVETKFVFTWLIKLCSGHLKSKEISTSHQNSGRMSRIWSKGTPKIGWVLWAKHIATEYWALTDI